MSLLKCSLCILALLCEQSVMASWSTPVTLTSYNHQATAPEVAVSTTGYAVAVWSEYDGNNTKIQSSTHAPGSKWAPSVTLSDDYESAFDPYVAINESGDAVAVWSSYDGQNASISIKFRTFGESWSKELVLTDCYLNAFNPQVAIDNFGNVIVVWENYDGMGLSIQGVTRTYYGLWSGIVDLSDPMEFGFQPKLAANSTGNAVVIWTGYDGENLYTEASTYEGNGNWSYPFYLSWDVMDSINPQVALNDEGDAIAIWSGFDGYNYIIQSSILTPDLGWSPPMIISDFGQDAYNPQIAIDSQGNGTAVWRSNGWTNYVVESSTLFVEYSSTPGSWFWTEPVVISKFGENAADPTVAIDPYGNAIALWTSLKDTHFVLEGAALSFGSYWSTAVQISDPTCDAMTPVVEFDGAGNATVLWSELYSHYVIQSAHGADLF